MKTPLLLLLSLSVTFGLVAQNNIGINNSSPDATSVLDVQSTTQGMLIPRMTTLQRTAIGLPGAPATGLLVYQTDAPAGFYFYTGAAWVSLSSTTVPSGPAGGSLAGTYPNPVLGTGVVANANVNGTAAIAYSKLNLTNSIVTNDLTANSVTIAKLPAGASGSTFLRGDGTWAAGGTVTSFSAGILTPLFTTSVATPTTTPALGFVLSTAPAHTFLGNSTASVIVPSYVKVGAADMSATGTPSTTTFLRGDNTWSTPPAPGFVITEFSGQPPGTVGTYYSGLGNSTTVTSAALTFPVPISKACTLDVFYATPVVYATYISGVTNVITGTIFLNGNPTSSTISVTVPNSGTINQILPNVQDNTHSIALVPGDIVTIQWTQTNALNGALAKVNISTHFHE